MNTFQIRVTDPVEDEKILTWVKWEGERGYIMVEEHATNRHIQGLIKTESSIRAVRESFRRKFPEYKGNGAYSITIWKKDPEHVHEAQYFLKESPPKILLNNMIPEADLPSIIEASIQHAIDLEKRGKTNVLTLLQEWAKPIKEKLSDQQIYDKAAEIIDSKNQTPRHLTMLGWVQAVQYRRGLKRKIQENEYIAIHP